MAVFRKEVPILNASLDVSSYDIVVIGSPVWACSTAPPVRSFIVDVEGLKGKKVAAFTTMYRGGGSLVVKCISAAARKKGASFAAGVCLSIEECLNNNVIKSKIKDFVKLLI
jgi:flavodoxin